MQLHLEIQEEMGTSFKAPSLHLVETAPSVLRKMPSVVLREHVVGIKRELHGEKGGKGGCKRGWR